MPKKKSNRLNANQEKFCRYYALGGPYFGNAVWSYILAYSLDVPHIDFGKMNDEEKKAYNIATIDASKLLVNSKIKVRVEGLLDSQIKNEVVDRELVKVILQDEELGPKVSAIKEHNAVKKRVDGPNKDERDALAIILDNINAQKKSIVRTDRRVSEEPGGSEVAD